MFEIVPPEKILEIRTFLKYTNTHWFSHIQQYRQDSAMSCRPGYGPDPEVVLRVSVQFLRQRELHDCKKYALQAQQSDPSLPGLSQILAVADVLLAAQTQIQNQTGPDYYSILKLEPFSGDRNILNENFKTLVLLLNPARNHYPFTEEAFELVRDAWRVLSDPSKKTQFDNLLKKVNGNENYEDVGKSCGDSEKVGNNGDSEKLGKSYGNSEKVDTFWTVCPYCYYVYEYAKVYEDCCLRCWNEKCGRGFHGLAINSPPKDALEDGKYFCSGVFQVGNEYPSWSPFVPMKSDRHRDAGTVGNADNNVSGGDNVVEISDDSEDSVCEGDKYDVSSKEKGTEEVNVEPTVLKPALKRKKKSVGRNTKKVTGTGIRVRKQDLVDQGGEEDMDWSAEASNGEEGIGFGNAGGMDIADSNDLVMGGM